MSSRTVSSRALQLLRRPQRHLLPAPCLLCQWRSFTSPSSPARSRSSDAKTAAPRAPEAAAASTGQKQAPSEGTQQPVSPLEDAPRGHGRRHEEFTPTPLARPIGMTQPPRPGENTGIDSRSLRQRRDDFVNYDKHLARREELKYKMSKPYFRDWSNLKFHQGKTFVCPPRPFRADVSLYFPNLFGRTLSKTSSKPKDTTPILQGRASVVSIFSSAWADAQAQSFVSAKANPALHEVVARNSSAAQLVQVNIEDNWFKAWLVQRFFGSLRRKLGKENWDRYFLVRRGLSDDIRERIGLLNGKVGYTYLVDQHCRIRWAGSGMADPGECEGLAKGMQRLLDEMKKETGQKSGVTGSQAAQGPIQK